MNPREEFIVLVSNEPLENADAIVLLEGDGLFRLPHAVNLYKNGWAPRILFSGGIDNKANGSFPKTEVGPELKKLGVKEEDIIFEDKSQHTRDQAVLVMNIAGGMGWKKIILVASHYHQYRAFLTFLKARKEKSLDLRIINSPARYMPWFVKNVWGVRRDLLRSEFEKIDQFQKSGHIASFEEAIEYQRWKEENK